MRVHKTLYIYIPYHGLVYARVVDLVHVDVFVLAADEPGPAGGPAGGPSSRKRISVRDISSVEPLSAPGSVNPDSEPKTGRRGEGGTLMC